MKRFEIGPGVTCDLDRLVDTRLLVQANSGGGKSFLLRRLLEQTHGHVQHLVIDPEGEFASLREKFDYVLAARSGGDTAADPRGAALLAERLLELKVSAILDIYELKPHERIAFVRRFLEALIDAPKSLWHPALVVVDEAHVYCPQVGEAESAGAVKDLATRGRKRGFCAVLATQRLSKLHKDAAAECNNKLIGRTSLDVDMDRAGDELGIKKADRGGLRDLSAGEFYAFGPAFQHTGIVQVHVGKVQTTHPKAGARLAFTAPPPTSKVRALLPKLADLPAEAEERVKSVDTLKRDVAQLRRELTLAQKAQPQAPAQPSPRVKELQQELARHRRALGDAMKILAKVQAVGFPVNTDEERRALEQAITAAVKQITGPIEKRVTALVGTVEGIRAAAGAAEKAIAQLLDEKIELTLQVEHREPFHVQAAVTPRPPRAPRPTNGNGDGAVSGVGHRILSALAELEQLGAQKPERELVALLAGYTHLQSKGFVNAMSALSAGGYVTYPSGGTVAMTDAGRAAAEWPDAPRSPKEVQERICALLGGASSKILKPLIDAYPNPMPRDAVAAAAGYGHLQSKGFVNAMSRLRTLGFIDYPDRGSAIAQPVLFLEAQ